MLKRVLMLVFIIVGLLVPTHVATAQSVGEYPIYIVQSGDTLNSIAIRFGVTVDEILAANNIADANLIGAGVQLIIPGLQGLSGILTTKTVNLGDSLEILSRAYQVSQSNLIKLNRITSPAEMYVGANLVVPQPSEGFSPLPITTYQDSYSLLETAVTNGVNPWRIALISQQGTSSWESIPGDVITVSNLSATNQSATTISPFLTGITISSLPLIQGQTASINIKSNEPLTLTGSLGNSPLHFFPVSDKESVALHGIYRMSKPGLYSFMLNGVNANNQTFSFEQAVLVAPMVAIYDYSLSVDPVTIDIDNTKPEDDLVKAIVNEHTTPKAWDGLFNPPIDVPPGYTLYPDCTTSSYGNLRSYNEGPYNYYHTGLDLSACGNNLNIYAVAPGKIVFADLLTVRGNYVVIDHGWGVFSAYGHMSKIDVTAGQFVEPGQLLGLIGSTGRVDGPHLHWEVWVNGTQVQPLDWLVNTYP